MEIYFFLNCGIFFGKYRLKGLLIFYAGSSPLKLGVVLVISNICFVHLGSSSLVKYKELVKGSFLVCATFCVLTVVSFAVWCCAEWLCILFKLFLLVMPVLDHSLNEGYRRTNETMQKWSCYENHHLLYYF